MDYQNIYNNLINQPDRDLIKEKGFEIHHILPVSLGGVDDNSNLVKLSYREHFIAHLLLLKIYPDSKSMIYCVWKWTHSQVGHVKVTNSRTHKIMREKYIESVTIKIDERELIEFFKDEKANIHQASKHFGYNYKTIKNNIENYGIKTVWNGLYNDYYTKTEIENMFLNNELLTLKELANIYNMSYAQLNNYLKTYDLEHLRPGRFHKNECRLIEYIISGDKNIRSSKLFKEFNMSASRVKEILSKHALKYISDVEVREINEQEKLENFINVLFKDIPSGYSYSGFMKHFKQHPQTIRKLLIKLNIKYKFEYLHHKGKNYDKSIKPIIRRGIDIGILK